MSLLYIVSAARPLGVLASGGFHCVNHKGLLISVDLRNCS